jgi:hypothetical protein
LGRASGIAVVASLKARASPDLSIIDPADAHYYSGWTMVRHF